ncbi:MAG: hypothetical protein ACUVQM_00195 [Candidatus Hadarchaeaceae archaeon]
MLERFLYFKSWLGKNEESRALGEAPSLIGYLTLAMKAIPNLERACFFASEQLGGRMGQDLKKKISEYHMRMHTGADEVLLKFSQRWGKCCPELGRAIHLIRCSVSEMNSGRVTSLDRSLQLVLQGAKQRVREFSSKIGPPTLLIYSLGILLPLVFVVILPVFSVIEFQMDLIQLVFIYCFLLPFLVYILSKNVLSKRPATNYPPYVPCESNFLRSALKAVIISLPAPAICFYLGMPSVLKAITLLWGIVLSLSTFLYFSTIKAYRNRGQIVQMEAEFSDALVQLGNRISEGRPAEEALKHVAVTMMGSKLAEVFMTAALNVELGGMGLRAALFDETRGALKEVNSTMIRGTLKMIVDLIERSTRTTGEAILQMAKHLRELRETWEEMRRSMAEVVTSMRSVAIFFAPLISSIAARVQEVLSEKVASLDFFLSTKIPPPAFLFVLGLYVIILTLILFNYVVEIELGDDRLAKRMAVAGALPLALGVFTAGAILGGQLVALLLG